MGSSQFIDIAGVRDYPEVLGDPRRRRWRFCGCILYGEADL